MRILFISANRVGDSVLTTGILLWLEQTYPQARFTIVCSPLTADLFRALPRLEKMILLKKKKHHAHWVDLWKQCVVTKWDIIVDFRNSFMTRLIWGNQKFYPHAHQDGKHKVEDHASAFHLDTAPAPTLWLDTQAKKAAEERLGTDRPIIAFGPAANWPPKQWPIEKFIELAKRFLAPAGLYPDARLMILAAPNERDQVKPLIDAFPEKKIINLIGADLLTAAACMKQAGLFVGNDSGLMHMAAAIGTPTIGLFGPGFPDIYGPWGKNTRVVRTPESSADLLARLSSPAANSPNLMQTLRVEDVLAAVKSLAEQK